MKYIAILGLILFPIILIAQEKLNKLKAPSSPASSILDIQPTTILTPKSYQALETALYSNFISDNSPVIPNDFALEFTPYWTSNHGLSLKEYLFPKSAFDQLIRNSSFSIASTQNFLLGDSTASNSLGVGYRTTFYMGNKKDRAKLEAIEENSDEIKEIYGKIALAAEKLGDAIEEDKSLINTKEGFIEAMTSVIYNSCYEIYKSFETASEKTEKILYDCNNLPELDTNNPNIFVDTLKAVVDENLEGDVIFNEYKTYIKGRYGFALDVAYAGFLNFPTNNFEFSIVPRQSIWLTPIYHFKGKLTFLKLMAVFRYDWYNLEYYKKYFPSNEIFENNFNYGLAFSTEFNKFSIQLEMVRRNSNSLVPSGTYINGNELFIKDKKTDFQYIGSLTYNLTEQIVLSYNLGNRFEPINNPENTLVSTLTLNFGFGTPTKSDLKGE